MVLPMDWAGQRYKVFQPRIIRNGVEVERNTVDLVTEKWATNLNVYRNLEGSRSKYHGPTRIQ